MQTYATAKIEREKGTSLSMEDIPLRSEAGPPKSKEETRPKEQREKRSVEVEETILGLQIYAGAANRFPEHMLYEEIVEGAKNGKFKITYTVKKSQSEMIGTVIKKNIKLPRMS